MEWSGWEGTHRERLSLAVVLMNRELGVFIAGEEHVKRDVCVCVCVSLALCL